jgi:hypothetical protein
MAKGLNTLYNIDVEINEAEKMFTSFFNNENVMKRKSAKKEQLIVEFDELFSKVEELKTTIRAIDKINKITDGIAQNALDDYKSKVTKELKQTQAKTKKARSSMTNLDKFTDKITIVTSFGEMQTTYKEVYANAGSVAEFFKKKIVKLIKQKQADYNKEIKFDTDSLGE